MDGSKEIASGTAAPYQQQQPIILKPNAPLRLWSPKDPFLYDVRIELVNVETKEIHDMVSSYVGVRTVALSKPNNQQQQSQNRHFYC